MVLELNSKLKTKIRSDLELFLSDFSVWNGMFLDTASTYAMSGIDKAIKNHNDLREVLYNYIGEDPLYHFFTESLSGMILDTQEYESESVKALTDIDIFKDVPALATSLVDSLETLPWGYTISFVLPESLSGLIDPGSEKIILSGNTRLARVTEQISDEFILTSQIKLRDDHINPKGLLSFDKEELKFPENSLLFQTQINGYIGDYDQSAPLRHAEARLRAFLGLLLALGVIKKTHAYHFNPPQRNLVIHQKFNTGWKIVRRLRLDNDFNSLIPQLEIIEFDAETSEKVKVSDWIKYRLAYICAAFTDTEDANKLLLAAKWLFNSYANGDDLLAYVQAMVCIEIVLGDRGDADEIGLGQTIRNRCAYLIGGSVKDRKEISDSLKLIYQIRSNIVHSGKDKLSKEEFKMLYSLRHYCARVLDKELELGLEEMRKKLGGGAA